MMQILLEYNYYSAKFMYAFWMHHPSKIRVFLWRLAQQSLPTGDVRFHRHMADTSLCSICGDIDSWRHSLINFPIARSVWALADEDVTEHISLNEDPVARQWIFAMMDMLSCDDFAKVAVTLRAIWYARRKIIHDGELQSPMSTNIFIQRYLQDLAVSSSERSNKEGGVQVTNAHPRWIPPRAGSAKINVDAAVAKTGSGGAVGAICRSETGLYMGASSLTIPGISDPAVLEAMACREALSLARDLHLSCITVSTDCLAVINNMK